MMAETTVEAKPRETKAPAPQPERSGPPKALIAAGVLAVLMVAGYFAWRAFFASPEVPENIVALSGRIEGDDSAVSPKASGRILEINFREGDSVKAGDVIAVLDDPQIKAREEQAQASVTQAEARVRAAASQIAILEEQLQQSQLETEQSKVDAEGRVRQAEAELAAAEAQLAQQEASLKLAIFDRDAYTRLAKTGAVSARQEEQAVTTAQTQEAAVAAARRRVEAAKAAVKVAQATLTNPSIRTSQSAAVRGQIAQQRSEIASAQADAERARAQLREALANRADLTVVAPFDGTIATRSAEPGEVVQPGTVLVTILDLRKVYLRGFVPEGQIGKVKVGQPARVYLDSNPNAPLEAYVSRVDPQATFTPENTYFREDRVKQVVGVKLQLKAGDGFAKPGMPADGEILLQGTEWPSGTRAGTREKK
jgi:HlyD family secretion protein